MVFTLFTSKLFCDARLSITVLLLLSTYIGVVQVNGQSTLTLSLENYNPTNRSTRILTATSALDTNSTLIITVNNVLNRGIQFFVIQIHSYESNAVLSYNPTFILTTSVNGSNIGLVQDVTNVDEYKFYVKAENRNANNTVLVVVVPYGPAPIPGGCNMEFMTEVAPYQQLTYTDSIVTVDAQPASVSGRSCELQLVRHDTYHMFMPEWDFSRNTYFDSILTMIDVDDILKYGTKVPKPGGNGILRRLYNAYKGTGSVYTVVATFGRYKSAYVPITSYACNALDWEDSCDEPTTITSKILCGAVVFLGLFTCYFGHKFFKTEMFLVGSLVGGYIIFLLLSVYTNLPERDAVITSLVLGVALGVLWLLFWWFCGIPVLSTLLAIVVLGFLFASIIFYAGLGDVSFVRNDLTYWGFFTAIIVLTMTILIGFMHKANILACAIVGAFAFVISIDHYYGSNLKYVFINTIRRATVDKFEYAVINPPFQYKDVMMVLVWGALALTGAVYQWRQARGRPPFPPTASRAQPPDERTPLLLPTSCVEPPERVILIQSTPVRA